MSAMTPAQVMQAKRWVAQGRNYAWMSKTFGCAPHTIRRAIDPEWAERRREQINQARRTRALEKAPSTIAVRPRPQISQDVEAELERLRSLILTPNQSVLGDPLPGRSALDRMGGHHG